MSKRRSRSDNFSAPTDEEQAEKAIDPEKVKGKLKAEGPKVTPIPSGVIVNSGNDIDDKLPHHKVDGSVDPAKVQAALTAIDVGGVVFEGPYHDNTRTSFRRHLMEHF